MISRITYGSGFQGSAASNSVDCTGGNLLLVLVGAYSTAPTYNGIALTADASGWYHMFNPPEGAHALEVGSTNSPYRAVVWAVYAGAKVSGFPDSSNSGSNATNVNLTVALTTIANNCWVVSEYAGNGDSGALAGGDLTQLIAPFFEGLHYFGGYADTNAAVAAGSHSVVIAPGTPAGSNAKILGIAPEPTPSVQTDAVTNLTSTTVTGNGRVTSGGTSTVTERGVVISTSANPTTADTKFTTTGTTGAFTVPVTGLVGAGIYHMRAFATNSSGTSYGSDVLFITRSAFSISVSTMSLVMTFPDIFARTFVFTNTSRPTTSITNTSKPTTTFTNASKPTTTFINSSKPNL